MGFGVPAGGKQLLLFRSLGVESRGKTAAHDSAGETAVQHPHVQRMYRDAAFNLSTLYAHRNRINAGETSPGAQASDTGGRNHIASLVSRGHTEEGEGNGFST